MGFACTAPLLTESEIAHLIAAFDARIAAIGDASPDYAMRDVFNAVPESRVLLSHPGVCAVVESIFDRPAFAVRCLFFDKVDGHNWPVGWHQDTAIAVRERIDTPGFGLWSVKAGAPHTKAPAAVLERMCAVRVHLDDCPAENGALRCVPGSHTRGIIRGGAAMAVRDELGVEICTVDAGGIVLMKPLTLHASSPAATPKHRRVIHIEVACDDLRGDLDWHERRPFAST